MHVPSHIQHPRLVQKIEISAKLLKQDLREAACTSWLKVEVAILQGPAALKV